MADTEIITTQFVRLNLGSLKPSNPIQKIIEAVTAQFAALMLGSSRSSKPIRVTRSILKANFDTMVNKLIRLAPVTNGPAYFQDPRKITGVKRRLEKSAIEPEEPDNKRQKTEQQDLPNLDAFESAQKISWEVYETCLDYSSPRRDAYHRVKSVIKTIKEQQVICLGLDDQIKAYTRLLKDASISSLPYYLAIFGRKVRETRTPIAMQIKVYERDERELYKTATEWRVYNSLKQKAEKEGDVTNVFGEETRCCKARHRCTEKNMMRVRKYIYSFKIRQRALLGLVRT